MVPSFLLTLGGCDLSFSSTVHSSASEATMFSFVARCTLGEVMPASSAEMPADLASAETGIMLYLITTRRQKQGISSAACKASAMASIDDVFEATDAPAQSSQRQCIGAIRYGLFPSVMHVTIVQHLTGTCYPIKANADVLLKRMTITGLLICTVTGSLICAGCKKFLQGDTLCHRQDACPFQRKP